MTTAAALADVVWERLQSITSATNVYDGRPPKGAGQRYACYYPGPGEVFGDRQGGGYRGLNWGAYVVCTGQSRAQLLNAVEDVRSALTGWWPDPSDSATALEEQGLGNEIQPDEDGISLSFTLRYTLTTNRS